MRALRLAALAAFLTGAGCHLGSRIDNLEPALGPYGARVRFAAGAVPVELLAVSDTALLVQRPTGALVLAPYRKLHSISFEHLGDEYSLIGRASTPDPAIRERWRLVARYPQGLRPDQLAQLLRAARQRVLEVL